MATTWRKRGHSGRTCAVKKCFNSSKKMQIWKETTCQIHSPLLHVDCPCLKPYSLHRFPGRKGEAEIRRQWVKSINRNDFVPKDHSVVCGIHFPDGRPTKEHPLPVLNLSYTAPNPVLIGLGTYDESSSDMPSVNTGKNRSPWKSDACTQWPDCTDHTYTSKLTHYVRKPLRSCGTQTDPTPAMLAPTKDKLFSRACKEEFWELIIKECSCGTRLAGHDINDGTACT